jgi:hypothetical protein
MIRTLDIHPAFGFESVERWEVACNQRDESLIQKGKDLTDTTHRRWGPQRMALNNFSKIFAYIPGLNVIIGIARIIFSLANNKSQDPVKKAIYARHIGRGIAEIFLGPLLLIADIVQTIRDKNVVQTYSQAHPELV